MSRCEFEAPGFTGWAHLVLPLLSLLAFGVSLDNWGDPPGIHYLRRRMGKAAKK